MIVREEDGFTLIRHYNSNPSTVEANGNLYSFVPEHGVSLCWVHPDDVHKVLSIKTGACCGGSQVKFWLANQNDLNVWTKGSY